MNNPVTLLVRKCTHFGKSTVFFCVLLVIQGNKSIVLSFPFAKIVLFDKACKRYIKNAKISTLCFHFSALNSGIKESFYEIKTLYAYKI